MRKHYSFSSRKGLHKHVPLVLVVALMLIIVSQGLINLPIAKAATTAPLGTAANFTVLGGSTVTNTGPTAIRNGNLGISPGNTVTGFPPGKVFAPATIQAGNAVSLQAQNDVTTAYNNLAGQPCNTDLTSRNLGGLTLKPGVYCFSSSAQLTGRLTLDSGGVANPVFIFQIGSTLTTSTDASISLNNGVIPCNIFWQLGSSATFGTRTSFVGNVLAQVSITLTTEASLWGRALARNGAVTLDSNRITLGYCDSPTVIPTPAPTATPTPTQTLAPTPSPSTAVSTETPAPTATVVEATETPTAADTTTPNVSSTPTVVVAGVILPGLPNTGRIEEIQPISDILLFGMLVMGLVSVVSLSAIYLLKRRRRN